MKTVAERIQSPSAKGLIKLAQWARQSNGSAGAARQATSSPKICVAWRCDGRRWRADRPGCERLGCCPRAMCGANTGAQHHAGTLAARFQTPVGVLRRLGRRVSGTLLRPKTQHGLALPHREPVAPHPAAQCLFDLFNGVAEDKGVTLGSECRRHRSGLADRAPTCRRTAAWRRLSPKRNTYTRFRLRFSVDQTA